jgi:hypothetical protein
VDANFFLSGNAEAYLAFNRVISITATAQFVILAIAAGIFLRSKRFQNNEFWRVLIILAAASILLMLPLSLPVWNVLPKLLFVQFPWRWLFAFNAAFACIFVAAAASLRERGWIPVMIPGTAHARSGTGTRVTGAD